MLAALATIGVAESSGITIGLSCRLLTGAALAGVYPPGMKIAAGWFKEGRGWAIGILVGALTLGSASPHLVRWAVPPTAWRIVLVVAALSGETFSYDGQFYKIPRIKLCPVPERPVPLLVGGHAEPALRRATRLSDGWVHGGDGDGASLAALIARLRELRADSERAVDPF